MRIEKSIKVFALVLALAVTGLYSQYYPVYYGKSKVIQYKFDWKMKETPHFRIHYYGSNPAMVKKIAEAAEDGYDKISRLLNVEIEKKTPIVFYRTHFDFEQTNLYPGFIPAGALAFAEPVGHRMVIQGEMSPDELSRTVIHELGHIFEYKILSRGLRFNPPPQWVMEGFSDYVTGSWNSFDLLIERDLVLSDLMPEITRDGDLRAQYRHGRTDYNWGHFIYDFIAEKFGQRGVRQLLFTYRGGGIAGGRKNFLKTFDYSAKLFNYDFRKYMRDKFKKFVTRENPEDYSYSIGPDIPYVYSFSHQVSPGGELLAVMTANLKDQDIDIIMISMKDGKVIKNITPGLTRRYDNIRLQFNPEDGSSFCWDNQGDKIAFFGLKEVSNHFIIMDVLKSRIIKQVKLDRIESPASPCFHPNGRELYFTGIEDSRSYIYVIDLQSYRVRRLTDGLFFIKALAISPDGTKIAFSAEQDQHYKLFLGPVESPEKAIKLTSGAYNDITPTFSKDSRFIYYSSDELESYNLYALDLKENTRYRYTDVRAANFFPMPIPGEPNQLVFSCYYKGMFHLFKKDISQPLEKTEVKWQEPQEPALEPVKVEIGAEEKLKPALEIKDLGDYKPLKTLFFTSLPPLTAGFGSDGSIFGYTSVSMADLMGDYNFNFFAASFYGYRSYRLSYLNLKNRLQYYTALFYYTDSYWISYNAYLKIRERIGATAGIFYPFSRDYRTELYLSYYKQKESYDDIFIDGELPYAEFFDGPAALVSASLVGETTRFGYYGPNSGHTFSLTLRKYLKLSSSHLDATSYEVDLRKYLRLSSQSLVAFRLGGYFSRGRNPQLYWLGGDNTIRAAEFRRLVGSNAFFLDAEFRFPLMNTSSTILGFIGPVRGVFFFDLGGVWMKGEKFRVFQQGKFRLDDAISSYGFGLYFNLWGYPFHLDWVYQTDLWAKKYYGLNFWIGFDF